MGDLEAQATATGAEDRFDEKVAGTESTKETESASSAAEPLLVTWDGDDDPTNPKNWSLARKWTITILTSCGGLVCLMSSTMLATALTTIAHDLDVSQAKANMTLSIFVLAFAFGPMVLAPMAEGMASVLLPLSCQGRS